MNEKPENRFNLVEEPWIPITGIGLASLRQVFSEPGLRALGGNPVQKIALTKLLLAIAQTAYTPQDDEDWAKIGSQGLATKCLAYLLDRKDCFWLYGEKPFLQMPRVKSMVIERMEKDLGLAENDKGKKQIIEANQPQPIGPGFFPDLPSENNTILTQYQIARDLSDAEKALFVVTLMNFAIGGKRVEKGMPPLSKELQSKSASAKSGPSIGNHWGYLHTYLSGLDVAKTVWLNLFTQDYIESQEIWSKHLGTAPWETPPKGEVCPAALALRDSYMGRLVGMSRFVYLEKDGIYYIEGIEYPSHKNGWREPSISINEKTKKLLWVNPDKRPWRELTALLAFTSGTDTDQYDCLHLSAGFLRARQEKCEIGVWSGGLKVRANAGDQSVKQDDDFVESEVSLPSSEMGNQWFSLLKQEMSAMEDISKVLYGTVLGYFKDQKGEGEKTANQASNLFWQLCERRFQDLVNACGSDNNDPDSIQTKKIRPFFARAIETVYNTFCPSDTARQIDAWAKNKPNLGWYLKGESSKSKTKARSVTTGTIPKGKE